ncbi:gluconokinase [Tepidibacillus infernus]|uniref:Gluconokinase n=1 Tax=Tepidibacillus decaturensis TaxID=1413211 RepID=A0A135L5G4_9BACI|nr:gluconokinase [Tepidibacillus decaturensis]KXG44254.1 gluconokinase [Tepidibacillus decaturensis]
MPEKSFVMGVDIGTTSTKATIFTTESHFVASHTIEYPLFHPKTDYAEQDPNQIYQAVLDSIKLVIQRAKLHSSQLLGIGFSSAMHSVIAVDVDGHCLTNSITWADNRSNEYAKRIKEEWNGHDIYLRTGTPIHPMSPLSKLMWFKEEAQEIFQKASKFISIKEFVIWKWFNQYLVDYSIASATGLFNLKALDWDQEALDLIGISKERLSKPVPTTTILKEMDVKAATYMNVPVDIPIVIGASDGVLANLGVGAIEPGKVALTIGTSGAIRAVVNQPITDPTGRTFCYALTENHWVIGGPMNNGGIALRWFKDQFSMTEVEMAKDRNKDVYDIMIEQAEKVQAGSNGLLFLPYLSGERAPSWNANARGVFFGMSITHQRQHFIRAILEGVIFGVYSIGKALNELAGPASEIRVSGGFARSEVWRQITADIFQQKVIVPESHESSGLGAAILTMYALGLLTSLEESKHMIHVLDEQLPNRDNAVVYEDLYRLFAHLSIHLNEQFDQISEFQRKSCK